MYTVETNRTRDIGSNSQPVWEVIVRDMHGHAVNHNYCYECDLGRMVAEYQNAYNEVANLRNSDCERSNFN